MEIIEEDVVGVGEDAVGRMSELNPRMLADIFADDPECTNNNKPKQPTKNSRAFAFAGSHLDDELELKKLQVFVRIRPPFTEGTPRWGTENCIHASSRHALAIAPPENSLAYKNGDRGQTYSFTKVFEDSISQEEYYSGTAAPLVADLLRDPSHNSVMMAYGITAAGKTYTLEGTKTQPGVVARAMKDVFQGMENHVDGASLYIAVSYFEVYNEQLYDLLEEAPPGVWRPERPQLKLKEDHRGRVFVAGLSEVVVNSADEALAVMKRGAKQRQRAETGLNQGSSRSHSVFQIELRRRQTKEELAVIDGDTATGAENNHTEQVVTESGVANKEYGDQNSFERLGRMAFVDLAGSERAQRTGNSGVRLKESVAINSSLMTLGRCLEALQFNQANKGAGGALKVVPFRESKVTHLFRDALHGYGRVVLSVNVSPCARDYDETTHVLKYAALATNIGTLQQAEAPRRTIKAVGPSCYENHKNKRKAQEKKNAAAAKKRKSEDPAPSQTADTNQQLEQQQQEEVEVASKEEAVEAAVIVENANNVGDDGVIVKEQQPVDATTNDEDIDDEAEAVYDVIRAPLSTAPIGHPPQTNNNSEHPLEEASPSLAANINDSPPIADSGMNYGMENPENGMDEYDGLTPSTPRDDGMEEDPEYDAAISDLQAQVQDLIHQLQQAEERAVLVETEVREEVSEEMALLLKEMEANYKERLASEIAAAKVGAGGGKGKRGAATAAKKRPGSASSSDGESISLKEHQQFVEKTEKEKEVLKKQLEESEIQVERLKQEIQLHDAQSRVQADRITKLENDIATAKSSEATATAEVERLTAELTAQRTQHETEILLLRDELVKADIRASSGNEEDRFADCLREQVAQMEANASMEVEMLDQQIDRLRKDNADLHSRLGAALAALAAVSNSPSGPTALQRVILACPSGGALGAGGTPHDVALARARAALGMNDDSGVPSSSQHVNGVGMAPLSVIKAAGIGGSGFSFAQHQMQQMPGSVVKAHFNFTTMNTTVVNSDCKQQRVNGGVLPMSTGGVKGTKTRFALQVEEEAGVQADFDADSAAPAVEEEDEQQEQQQPSSPLPEVMEEDVVEGGVTMPPIPEDTIAEAQPCSSPAIMPPLDNNTNIYVDMAEQVVVDEEEAAPSPQVQQQASKAQKKKKGGRRGRPAKSRNATRRGTRSTSSAAAVEEDDVEEQKEVAQPEPIIDVSAEQMQQEEEVDVVAPIVIETQPSVKEQVNDVVEVVTKGGRKKKTKRGTKRGGSQKQKSTSTTDSDLAASQPLEASKTIDGGDEDMPLRQQFASKPASPAVDAEVVVEEEEMQQVQQVDDNHSANDENVVDTGVLEQSNDDDEVEGAIENAEGVDVLATVLEPVMEEEEIATEEEEEAHDSLHENEDVNDVPTVDIENDNTNTSPSPHKSPSPTKSQQPTEAPTTTEPAAPPTTGRKRRLLQPTKPIGASKMMSALDGWEGAGGFSGAGLPSLGLMSGAAGGVTHKRGGGRGGRGGGSNGSRMGTNGGIEKKSGTVELKLLPAFSPKKTRRQTMLHKSRQ